MPCLTLPQIENTVMRILQKASVDSRVHSHLKSCAFCRTRLNDMLNQSRSSDTQALREHPRLLRLIDTLMNDQTPSHVFIAFPIEKNWARQQLPSLAADTRVASQRGMYINRGVLATADGDLLIRIIEHQGDGTTTLHLLSDAPEKVQHVLITIPNLGTEYFSDEGGKVYLGQVDLHKLDNLRIEVHTPHATFDLECLSPKIDEIVGRGEVEIKNPLEDRIQIEITPSGRHYTLKVLLEPLLQSNTGNRLRILVSRGTDRHYVQAPKEGVAVFSGLDSLDELRIQVFS